MSKIDFRKNGEIIFKLVPLFEGLVCIYFYVNNRFIFSIIMCILFVSTLLYILYPLFTEFFYNRKKLYKNNVLVIEGKAIDSLFIEQQQRKRTDTLLLKSARHKAIINENNLSLECQYRGICIDKEGESQYLMNIHGDNFVSFNLLNCYGYDLMNDDLRKTKIPAILKSSDGLSKKIAIPFNKRLKQFDEFSLEVHYTWPGCMHFGQDYYVSALSFKKSNIETYTVELVFKEIKPLWVRAYNSEGKIIKNISLKMERDNSFIYEDSIIVEGLKNDMVRVYFFFRERSTRYETNN